MKTINNIFDQSFFQSFFGGCILIVLICSFNISNAITITSVQTGNWDDPATWNCACELSKKDNVIISSGHTITLTDDIKIKNLTIESTAALDVSISNYKIIVEGNWVNNGIFLQREGEVIFSGSSPQIIGGSNATFFYDHTIDNISGSGITLTAPITTTHNLTLTEGVLYTNNTNYITMKPTAITIGASDDSYINGLIKIETDTIKKIVFDTGKNGKHKKIAIDVNSTNTTAFVAEYFDVAYVDTNVGPGIDHLTTTEYWQLYRVVGNAGVSVTLYWDVTGGNGPMYNLSNARVVRFDSTQWVDAGNAATTWSPPSIMSDSLNSYGYFTFGYSNSGHGDDDTTACGKNKVEICHIPPGNPSNAHAMCINSNALNAHLAHGDYEGPCEGSDTDSSDTDSSDPDSSDPDSSDPDTSGTGNDILEFEISVMPNPYSGYANIQYTLPEDGSMLIEVYDRQAHKIQTIVSAVQVAGVYSYRFSAVSLGYSPGYYLLNYTFWGAQTISNTVVLLEL